MIPLNKPYQLPAAAAWYWLVRSLFVCGAIVLFAYLLRLGLVSPSCRGTMCGTSGKGFTSFLYIFAVMLAARAVVNTLTCSFVLSEKSITINRGLIFRNSSTIRFDRIQDLRGNRGPLLDVFGLEAIALWTASPDQRVGNSRRPDGQLLLNVQEAEWLKQLLAEPSAHSAEELAPSASSHTGPPTEQRSSLVVGSVLLVVGALILWGLLDVIHNLHLSPTVPASTTSNSNPADATATPPSSATPRDGIAHRIPDRASGAHRVLTCTLTGPAGEQSTVPCHQQAQRCEHERDFASNPTTTPAALTLVNRGHIDLQFDWLDSSGERKPYGTLAAGGRLTQPTRVGAHWLLATPQGECVGILDAATVTLNVAY
jgi:membrane protein YdbS with pleckstrin-like domain